MISVLGFCVVLCFLDILFRIAVCMCHLQEMFSEVLSYLYLLIFMYVSITRPFSYAKMILFYLSPLTVAGISKISKPRAGERLSANVSMRSSIDQCPNSSVRSKCPPQMSCLRTGGESSCAFFRDYSL
jgi:hypothetical protein